MLYFLLKNTFLKDFIVINAKNGYYTLEEWTLWSVEEKFLIT